MTGILLCGFVISILFFLILFWGSNTLLNNYFSTSSFRQDASNQNIDELQAYVKKNNISATDTERLREWAKQKHIGYFTISRERMLLYDNSYSGTIPLERTESEQLHYTWQYFQVVSFADGDADVFIYENFETKYYILVDVIAGVVSVMVWLGIFVLGVRHEVRYIKQLSTEASKLEAGLWSTEFTLKGQDELTDLAAGLEHMRTALIEKEKKEENMKSAQNKLVLGMAHDLRTPLTSLMAYLEVIKRQKSVEEAYIYIDKTVGKAIQIKNLSDQLFEFFLVNSDQLPEMETADNVEFILGDYLSELCNLLENEGYMINIDELEWRDVKIKVCYDYVGRIINNILSNIMKYADKNTYIKIHTRYFENELGLLIENNIAKTIEDTSGTGIGVNNICSMMMRMGGRCETKIEKNVYAILLGFPINPSDHKINSSQNNECAAGF